MEDIRTLVQFFERSVGKWPDNPFIWQKEGGEYRPTTYRQTHEEVRAIAAGLITLGIEPGSRVGLLSEGRRLWIESELGMLHAACVEIPLSIKLEGADLQFRLHHSGAVAVIVSEGQAQKVEAMRAQLPQLRHIIHLDPKDQPGDGEVSMARLKEMGREALARDPEVVSRVSDQIRPEDFANISYTSGTTSDPKGVILTHRNYVEDTVNTAQLVTIPEHFVQLVILPMDHSFAHVAGIYSFMYRGASLAMVQAGKSPVEALRNIPVNMREVRPHMILSVPALAKNFRANILKGIKDKGGYVEGMFSRGLRVAYAYNREGHNRGRGLRALLYPLVRLYDRLIFSKVRESFGGRLEYFIGGGAYLDLDLQKFFYAIGIPMFQGYGLTEATPIISTNSPENHKLGTSGRPIPNMDVRIVDEEGHELPRGQKGEICVRGGNVMLGYWKNEVATAATIVDGWLHTGDMGFLDTDGYLSVLGRFKSLLIGMDGEKYSPEGIEETLVQHSALIDQVLLHNNQRPYTTALVVPNGEALRAALARQRVNPQSEEAARRAIELIDADMALLRTDPKLKDLFPERWQASTYAIVDEPFSEANGLLNSTMKLIRHRAEERYAAQLEHMYTPEGKPSSNPSNLAAIAGWLAP
ncbi:MAG: long-chain fatty acid--CoA ligase [Bacteroidia bacterium]|nr:MAG: long-chain fatty acid--CoA ligase [Bacteroidia bacterium]